ENGKLSHVFDAGERTHHLPFGPLAGDSERITLSAVGTRVRLRFASGVLLEGELASGSPDAQGRISSARLSDYRLESERFGISERGTEYWLCVAQELSTAHAGAFDPSYHAATQATGSTVPKPRQLAARERELLSLYERAIEAFRSQAGSAALP